MINKQEIKIQKVEYNPKFSSRNQLFLTALLTFVCGNSTLLSFISFSDPSHTPFISFFNASPSEMSFIRKTLLPSYWSATVWERKWPLTPSSHRSDSQCKTVFSSCGMFVWLIKELMWPLTSELLRMHPSWCQQVQLMNYYTFIAFMDFSHSKCSIKQLLNFCSIFLSLFLHFQAHFWAKLWTSTSVN